MSCQLSSRYIIFIYLYIYTRASALFTWIYGKTEKRIDKTTMPDDCNFAYVTYALKIKARDFFREVDSIVISSLDEKSETTLDLAALRD